MKDGDCFYNGDELIIHLEGRKVTLSKTKYMGKRLDSEGLVQSYVEHHTDHLFEINVSWLNMTTKKIAKLNNWTYAGNCLKGVRNAK